jgi:hypothetical protein
VSSFNSHIYDLVLSFNLVCWELLQGYKNYLVKLLKTTIAHIPLHSMPFYVSYSLILSSLPGSCDGQHWCFESPFSMCPCLYMPFDMRYASSGMSST